jgi:prepilin-type N-terminal cleavage/methylation domain-containing protein
MNTCALKKLQSGLTLIELMVVVAVLGVLFSLTTINLTRLTPKANVNATVDTFIADVKQQQQKSMLGETGGMNISQPFGVHVDTNQYVLYGGISYSSGSASNSAIVMPSSIQLSTSFGSGNILFNKGSGEINGFSSSNNTITVNDLATGVQKVIEFNQFGIVMDVN